jgi:hypothetical protein
VLPRAPHPRLDDFEYGEGGIRAPIPPMLHREARHTHHLPHPCPPTGCRWAWALVAARQLTQAEVPAAKWCSRDRGRHRSLSEQNLPGGVSRKVFGRARSVKQKSHGRSPRRHPSFALAAGSEVPVSNPIATGVPTRITSRTAAQDRWTRGGLQPERTSLPRYRFSPMIPGHHCATPPTRSVCLVPQIRRTRGVRPAWETGEPAHGPPSGEGCRELRHEWGPPDPVNGLT